MPIGNKADMTEMERDDFSAQSIKQIPMLKIGIVEDEIVIAENIAATLSQLGYDVPEPANNYIEAISMLTKHKPDLVLLDIMLNDTRDGVELAERINKEFQIPFVFLTANADKATVGRAKLTEPAAYLIKPFTKNDLYASIEIAATKHNLHGNTKGTEGSVFVKEGLNLRKLVLHEITHLESERVYLHVHTKSRSVLLRKSIAQFLEKLNDARFMQIHRSHAVNVHHIDEVGPEWVIIEDKKVPVSKSYRAALLAALQK